MKFDNEIDWYRDFRCLPIRWSDVGGKEMRNSGKKVFNKCGACHAVKPAKKKLGPSLHGVIGRKAGSESHFKYSPAMKSLGIEWTEENLENICKLRKIAWL